MKQAPPERLPHLARHLHDLGPQALFYFIREIISGADPIASLEAYARLDPAIVRTLGGDQMPALVVVESGRR